MEDVAMRKSVTLSWVFIAFFLIISFSAFVRRIVSVSARFLLSFIPFSQESRQVISAMKGVISYCLQEKKVVTAAAVHGGADVGHQFELPALAFYGSTVLPR